MAIFSLHHSTIGKTTHKAGTAGAHIHYVTRRRAASAVLSARMPIAAPGKAYEVRAWFNGEEATSRKNGRVADKIMAALPIELDDEQRLALVRNFAEAATGGRAPWLAVIHSEGKDKGNPHLHLVIRDRDPTTGRRAVGLSEKGSTDRLRGLWERHANAALEIAGVAARIDRRSLADQGVEREPQIHVGPRVQAMEACGVRPASRDQVDGTGREIRWTEIDADRTRADRRAEIVAANIRRAEIQITRPLENGHDYDARAAAIAGRGAAPGGSWAAPLDGDRGNASRRRRHQVGYDGNTRAVVADRGRKPRIGDTSRNINDAASDDFKNRENRNENKWTRKTPGKIATIIELSRANSHISAASLVDLAKNILDDARLGPLGRVLRDLDQREQQVRAQLSELARPLEPPASLDAVQSDVREANARRRVILDERIAAAARLEVLIASRPRGVWSWISGAVRAHERLIAQVEAAVSRSETEGWLATVRFQAAEDRLKDAAKAWDRQKRSLEATRADEMARFEAELIWIVDVRACVAADLDLAAEPRRLEEAVKAMRAERAKNASMIMVPRPPSYRP